MVIVGPTASGKTRLSVQLAKKFNGEIVSADSRQIYKSLDIGSGKDKHLYKNVPVHLLDIASPKRTFTVSQFQKQAFKTIDKIHERNRLPILCGGSGLYIKAVTEGLNFPVSKPDLKLRRKLAKKSLAQLLALLKKKDFKTYSNIDKHNRRRIERALEILIHTKRPLAPTATPPPYRMLILGLKTDKDKLKRNISKRLIERLDNGLIAEVKNLKKSLSDKRLNSLGLEYAWVNKYLNKQINRPQLVSGLSKAIIDFAKRQITWFNKNKQIIWMDGTDTATELVSDLVSK